MRWERCYVISAGGQRRQLHPSAPEAVPAADRMRPETPLAQRASERDHLGNQGPECVELMWNESV